MRLLGTYLWKEWRDHRAVLVGMVIAVPLLLAVAGLSLPGAVFDDSYPGKREGFAAVVALACLAIFVVSLATDLVPGEARRGHRWLLERLPGGLGAAFRGKLVLFVLGSAFFAAYGYLGAAVTCRSVAGEWPAPPPLGPAAGTGAILAIWIFAVSCFLPRGALSVPATAALALLLVLPAALAWMLYPSDFPKAWWRWESGILWTAGGIWAAWAGFRRRGLLRGGRACLAVGAVCAMPYWADAAHDAWRWHDRSVVAFSYAIAGEGWNYAFVNRYLQGPDSRTSPVGPVIVDLRTGSAREVGDKFSHFSVFWVGFAQPTYRFTYLWSGKDHEYLDARTAERTQVGAEERTAACRAAAVWRYEDGALMWFRAGRLVVEAADGSIEEVPMGSASWAGLGLQSWSPRCYYDFARRRLYRARELSCPFPWIWIRPGAWLGRSKAGYQLFDPDTNTSVPAQGLVATDDVRGVLDDGRVIVLRRGEGLLLVAPESGEVTRPQVPPGFESASLWTFDRRQTPGAKRVFQLFRDVPSAGVQSVFVRQEGDAFIPTATLDAPVSFLGCPTEDEVIAHDDRAIYRLKFGTDQREEIWRAR